MNRASPHHSGPEVDHAAITKLPFANTVRQFIREHVIRTVRQMRIFSTRMSTGCGQQKQRIPTRCVEGMNAQTVMGGQSSELPPRLLAATSLWRRNDPRNWSRTVRSWLAAARVLPHLAEPRGADPVGARLALTGVWRRRPGRARRLPLYSTRSGQAGGRKMSDRRGPPATRRRPDKARKRGERQGAVLTGLAHHRRVAVRPISRAQVPMAISADAGSNGLRAGKLLTRSVPFPTSGRGPGAGCRRLTRGGRVALIASIPRASSVGAFTLLFCLRGGQV